MLCGNMQFVLGYVYYYMYLYYYMVWFLLTCVSYSTFLKDCPFMIKVRMSPDGNKLVIKEMGGEHNHNLSKVSISIN